MAEQQIGVEGQVGHQMGEQFASNEEQGLASGSDRAMMMMTAHIVAIKMFFG